MMTDTIYEFNQAGLQGIIHQPKGGRPAKITEEFLKTLLELVECDPRSLGCQFSSWTAENLTVVLAEQTGLAASKSCVQHTLHQQGYTVQRPVLTVSSSDPEYEQKRAAIEELRCAEAGEIDLYYEADVNLALSPGLIRCWRQCGHQRKIETPCQNKKPYGAGLIHWVSGQLHWVVSKHKHNALFRAVLAQVISSDGLPVAPTPRKKYVVVDNYHVHFAKAVQA
jgi:transposase